MASTIQIKRNTASGQTPQSLVSGELAVNVFDRKLYVGNNASGVTGLLGEDFKITTQASAGSIAHLKLFNVPYGNTRGTVSNTIALVGDDAITVARAANGAITFALDNDFGQSFPTDSGTGTPSSHALTIAGGNGINTSGTGATVTVTLAPTITSAHSFGNDTTFVGATSGRDAVWDTSDNAFEFADNAIAKFGTGGDLEIFHDSNNSALNHTGTGDFYIQSDQFYFRSATTSENYISATVNGSVKLYDNGAEKISTAAYGVNITGVTVDDGATHDGDVTFNGAATNMVWDKSDNALEFADSTKATFGTGADLAIYHDGSNSYIDDASGTGSLIVKTNQFTVRNAAGDENMIAGTADGGVQLSYDNSVKFQTLTGGASVTGNLVPNAADGGALGGASNEWSDLYLADSATIQFGADQDVQLIHVPDSGLRMPDGDKMLFGTGDDLQIYHDGSHSYINDAGTGNLKILGSQIDLLGGTDGAETMATFVDNGAVTLYYDNSAKLATKTDGVDITGELQSDTLDVDGNADISGTLTIGTNLTVAGNHHIDGNLTVEGATTYVSSSTVKVDDSMLILAANNAAHTVDAGVYQKYVSSGTKFAGYFFDASDNVFKFFKDTAVEPTTTVNLAGSGYAMAQLDAVIDGGTF